MSCRNYYCLILYFVLVIFIFSLPVYSSVPWEGDGTENSPYLIYDANDMQEIGADPNYWNVHFKLMADIDLSQFQGEEFNIIGNAYEPFTGIFDGNCHSINNFSYAAGPETVVTGIFGDIDDPNAGVFNLTVKDVNVYCVEEFQMASAVVGRLDSGKIANCIVEGGKIVCTSWAAGAIAAQNDGTIEDCNVNSVIIQCHNFVGGLVGDNRGIVKNCSTSGLICGLSSMGGIAGGCTGLGTKIENCSSECTIIGDTYVGGLVGQFIARSEILNSSFCGTVEGKSGIGGLVGSASLYATIRNSFADVNVIGIDNVGGLAGSIVGSNGMYYIAENCFSKGYVSASGQNAGGFVGNAVGSFVINNCYCSSIVDGNDCVGAFAGSISRMKTGGIYYSQPAICNCYSTGLVVGDSNVGGMVGLNDRSYAYSCYWDTQTSGQQESAVGIGLTTEQMQDSNNFAGWGCQEVWTIDDGDYPRLFWENKLGQPIQKFNYGGGTGEPNDPYLIYTAQQFVQIAHSWCDRGKHFMLMSDVDLEDYADRLLPIGQDIYERTDYGPFCGVFDGNGYSISNYVWESNDIEYVGLFGFIDDPNSKIMNLKLIAPQIKTERKYVGSLVGMLNTGKVQNCLVEGGGVEGNYEVGGLVGNNQGIVENCGSESFVKGIDRTGGLAGANVGTILSSFSKSVVEAYTVVGGLVGAGFGDIYNCFSTGDVSAETDSVGGLIGTHSIGDISNCYSASYVEGAGNVGGLVGYCIGGDYEACFWNMDINPDVNSIGNGEKEGIFPKTTYEMQQYNTYADAGWDFVGEELNGVEDIWAICDGTNYPRLVWQIPAPDIVCPDGVDFLDFAFFADYWLSVGCAEFDNCYGVDFDLTGTIDIDDLIIFTGYWLSGL